MDIGTTIKRLRKEKKLSQTQFSELTGISQTSLSQIENGVTIPYKSNLDKICEVLETPKHLLFLLSLENSDVPEANMQMYERLYPTIKELMLKIFYEDNSKVIKP